MLVFFIATHITPANAETYTYDAAGRLTSVTYDDGSSITYTYDNTGNILELDVFIEMSLADTILILQVMSGIDLPAGIYKEADVNEDNLIGLEEVIYIFQKLSGLR